VETII